MRCSMLDALLDARCLLDALDTMLDALLDTGKVRIIIQVYSKTSHFFFLEQEMHALRAEYKRTLQQHYSYT